VTTKTIANLLDEIASAQPDQIRIAERGDDLSAGDERQPLDTVEICVLNGHHATISEQLEKLTNKIRF